MRFITALAALASASFAAAQTATSSAVPAATGKCDAQNIVDACVAGIKPQIQACGGNDWMCLCTQYTNLLTCYNNCPGIPEQAPVQNQVTSFCTAAAPLFSSSSAAAATMSHRSTTLETAAATGSATGMTAAGSATGTAAAATASSTGLAGIVVAPIGGLVAVFLGLAGLL